MKRRRFLAAGAAALTWPGWLARAFAQVDEGADVGLLAEALDRARHAGRPVWVIVVPEDAGSVSPRWYGDPRGQAWGELILGGSDDTLAELTLAEVICAQASTVHARFPSATPASALAFVIEPDGAVRALEGELPGDGGDGVRDIDAIENAITARIAVLAGLVHRGLAADDTMIARRERDARAALGATLDPLTHALAGDASALTPELAAVAPALVFGAMHVAHDARRDAWRASLVSLATTRLRSANVPGSQWRNVWDCPPCGMAYVPTRGRSFLDWVTST